MVQPDTQTASAPVGVSGTESPAQAGERDPAALAAPVVRSSDELVDDELLVEEVSIDGMCGVY